MKWHHERFGFGVISLALWMAEMTGSAPEGILNISGAEKPVHNLGEIMSGRADPPVTETPTESPTGKATRTSSSTSNTMRATANDNGGQHCKSQGGGTGKKTCEASAVAAGSRAPHGPGCYFYARARGGEWGSNSSAPL